MKEESIGTCLKSSGDNRHAIPEFFDKFPIFNQEFFKESSYACSSRAELKGKSW